MKAEPLVVLDELGCDAGERRLFSGVSCTIHAGEALLVTGANGAGKSTFLRIVAGLRRAASGEISTAAAAHYVGHALGLKPELTGRQHLSFWGGLSGHDPHVPEELTAFVDLPVGALSRGQAQRLALARLGLDRRPIWLLDEPTGPLDIEATAAFVRSIDEHIAAGGAAIIATHRPLHLDPTPQTLRIGR